MNGLLSNVELEKINDSAEFLEEIAKKQEKDWDGTKVS